ncbi:MAG: Holliday junction branch migration protein RuvA [Bacteroidales bacterium]|nr:Holliday junction branch migration protein RuvA [Candidatus Cryptobacteroides equifaecalis]
MIDFISGKIAELTPTMVVVENNGIGYCMEISLQTYSSLENKESCRIYIQKQVNQRDGTDVDYGFSSKDERDLFRLITSVSGMGASSARMILSSMNADEFRETILSEDVNRLKSVKGIGLKSAQRMILELKDKIVKGEGSVNTELLFKADNSAVVEEATSALIMLGFAKPNINKAIQQILKNKPDAKVEEIIKNALRML